jgi:gliding motility-associated-like protein
LKKILLILICLASFLKTQAQPFWFKNHGGAGNDEALDITNDLLGNHIVTGYFTQSVAFGSTTLSTASISDIFIAKYSPTGSLLWAVQAGGTGPDRGYSVRCDPFGNIYVTGYYNGTATFGSTTLVANAGSQDIFVVKLDALGNFIWAKTMGSDMGDTGYGISTDNSGNVLVTGQFKGTADFGSSIIFTGLNDPFTGLPAYELFVAKLDSAGTTLWVQPGFTQYDDRGLDVDCDNAGNIYVVGQFSDTILLDVTHNNPVQNAGFLLKLDPAGTELDFRRLSAVQTLLYSIDVDVLDNINVCGEFQGTLAIQGTPTTYVTPIHTKNILVARFNTSCNVVWTNFAGSENDVSAKSIITDNSGNVLIAGTFNCKFDDYAVPYGNGMFYSAGYRDVFSAKYDNSGNFVWAKNAGGPADDFCSGISLSPTNLPVLAGGMNKNFSFVTVPGIGSDPVSMSYSYCAAIGQGPITYKGPFLERNIFVGSFMEFTTPILDVFNHAGASCSPDLLLPRLGLMGEDTAHYCQTTSTIILTPKTQHLIPLGIIGAYFDYDWHDGVTTPTHPAPTTGWYEVDVKRRDGCYSNNDSLFVFIHPLPPPPLITDSYGVNILHPPFCDSIYQCGDDTITLSANQVHSGPGFGWSETWTGSSFVNVNDSVIKIYASGVYQFTNVSAYNCVSYNNIKIVMDTFALHDTLKPYLLFHPTPVNDTITLCKGSSIAITCNDTTYFNGHHMNHKRVDWFFGSLFSLVDVTWDYHQTEYTPTVSGWFHVYAHLHNLCADTVHYWIHDSVYIVVNPPPAITYTFIPDTYICPSDTVTHIFYTNAVCTYSFSGVWMSHTDSLITTLGPGNLLLSLNLVDTVTGCTSHKPLSAAILGYPKPEVNTFPADGIVCPGDSVMLHCETALTYSWVGPMGDSIGNTQDIYVDVPGFYHCIVTDLTGCPLTSNTVEVKEYNTPYIEVLESPYICPDGTATIVAIASSSALINWESPLSGSGTTITVDTAGVYYCSITLCGVTTVDSALIIESVPVAYIIAADSLICPGDSLLLIANGGMVDYLWSPSGSHNSFLYITEPGTYNLTTTNAFWCNAYASITITAKPQPAPPVINDTIVCAGTSVTLTATASGSISWYTSATGGIPFNIGNTYTSGSIDSSTTYYLQTNDSVCGSNFNELEIGVYNGSVIPVISGDPTVCHTDSLYLYTDSLAGVTYTWITPSDTITGLSIGSFVGDSTIDGTYYLLAFDNFCASDTVSIVVTHVDHTILSISSPGGPICPGDSISLVATPGFDSYSWSGGGTNDSLYVSDSSTYVVSGILNGCPEVSNPFAIEIFPEAITPVSSDQFFCYGSAASFSATGDTLISWFDSSENYLASGSNYTSVPLFGNTGFFIQSTNVFGCSSAMISVNAILVVNPAPVLIYNDPVCEGTQIEFYSNYSDSTVIFNWWGPNSFSSSLTNPQIINSILADSGTYYMAYMANGCYSDTASIEVNIHANPVADIISTSLTVCEFDSLFLNAAQTNGYSYNWTLENGTDIEGNDALVLPSTRDDGWVVLTVTDSLGCVGYDSVMIIVKPMPLFNFFAAPEICAGEILVLNSSVFGSATSYIHDDSVYTTNNLIDTIMNVSEANEGLYTMVADLDGCIDSTSIWVEVTQYPQIWLGNDTAVCAEVGLDYAFPEQYSYNWSNGDSSNVFTIANSGWTWVTATLGICSVTDSIEIVYLECDPSFPNVFTPNGDGVNDIFRILSDGVVALELKIYDRWGVLIFSAIDNDGVWDGINNSGIPAAEGVYAWTATVKNLLEQTSSLNGWVHLNR